MKTRNFVQLLLSVCLLYACINDEMSIPDTSKQALEVTNVSNVDDAKILLEDFINETYSRSNTNSFKIKSHRIRNVHINSTDAVNKKKTETIPVYEFVTETDGKEGFSVVVSDKRVDKVLISVPQGSLADTAFIEPLRLYYHDIPLLIEQDLKQYNEGTQETTTLSRMTAETCYRFTSTNWGQGEPYNNNCPNQFPAGCLPISVAQILAYHQLPSNLNWLSILASPTVTTASGSIAIDQVSALVHDLGVSLGTEYGLLESITTYQHIVSVLSSYGLRCAGVIGFSISDAKYSLQNGGPFIMSAMPPNSQIGHTWVCDGWKRHIYEDGTYYDYLNMNWGWDGNSNGFYYVENPMSFSVNGHLYNRGFQMVNNIRKQ